MLLNLTGDYGQLMKFTRVTRLYKLVKLTRLLRLLKLMKEKSKIMKYLNDLIKLGLGFERLFFFAIICLMTMHIATCLWVVVAALINDDDYKGTWMEPLYEKNFNKD